MEGAAAGKREGDEVGAGGDVESTGDVEAGGGAGKEVQKSVDMLVAAVKGKGYQDAREVSLCLSIHLSVRLSVCVSVCKLSVCLSGGCLCVYLLLIHRTPGAAQRTARDALEPADLMDGC